MLSLDVNEKVIYPKYLFAALRSSTIRGEIENLHVGSMIPHFKKGDFNKLFIPYPDSSMQRFIGDTYFDLRQKIDLLQRHSKTLELLAETIFRQWFIEDADNSWEPIRIGNYFNISRGLSYKGSGLCESFLPNCKVMLNLNSVFESGGYKDNGVKYYNGEFKDRHRIFPGDLIITNTEQGHEHRLIGFGAIVPKNIEDWGIFSQHIYRVTSKGNILSTNYLYYLLKEANMREQMIGGTNGSTVNMLPIESVENAKTVMPSKSKLLKFNAIAKDVQSKRESNQTQIMQLNSLQDFFLSKFINSTTRVNNHTRDTHS